MDQGMEVAPGADVSSCEIACWYNDNDELWAILCRGHRDRGQFLSAAREVRPALIEEIQALREALGRRLTGDDVHWLWIELRGAWYYWCEESTPGAEAVTAIPIDLLPELQS